MVLVFCLCGAAIELGFKGWDLVLFWDGIALMAGKKSTIRPWAGEWLWSFQFQMSYSVTSFCA
jgi:hypothetical protein